MSFSKSKLRSKNSGFTIIEVIIVLAIAGLIMAVVFFAITQVQASRRDSERKAYAGLAYEAMLEYFKNNKKIPSCVAGTCASAAVQADARRFIDDYLPEGTDPGTGYDYVYPPAASNPNRAYTLVTAAGFGTCNETVVYLSNPAHYSQITNINTCQRPGTIVVSVGAHCASSGPGPTNGITSQSSQLDKFAVLMYMERGGWFCRDNYAG